MRLRGVFWADGAAAYGCPDGHSFCRACYVKWLRKNKGCPTCRHAADKRKLVRNRPLEGIISQMNVRCENSKRGGHDSAGGGSPAAKRAKLTACEWTGLVGELAVHLGGCDFAPVKCLYQGCTESPLRRDLLEHQVICGDRKVQCSLCVEEVECRSLAEARTPILSARTRAASE